MPPTNREQRRHPERNENEAGIAPPERPQSSQHDTAKAASQDVANVRAKGSGHGKKTADKWNQ